MLPRNLIREDRRWPFEIMAYIMTAAACFLGLRFIFAGGGVLKEWGVEVTPGALILFRRLGLIYLGLALMFFLGTQCAPLGYPLGGVPGHGRRGRRFSRLWGCSNSWRDGPARASFARPRSRLCSRRLSSGYGGSDDDRAEFDPT